MGKILFVLTALLLLSGVAYGESRQFLYASDGDTLVFYEGICRLAYIDAPEKKYNKDASLYTDSCVAAALEDITKSGKSASYDVEVLGTDSKQRDICVIEHKNHTIKHAMGKGILATKSQQEGLWKTYPGAMECMHGI